MSEANLVVLHDVFKNVLEKLAFMFADEVKRGEGVPEIGTESVLASIRFSGPMGGRIELVTSMQMCNELSANMLGLDPDDETTELKGRDSLGELLNVTCGNFLTALAGEAAVFVVEAPRTSIPDASDMRTMVGSSDCVFMTIEDTPIMLRLCLEKGE